MRSGTTLVRYLSCSHAQVSLGMDLGCFHGLGRFGAHNALAACRRAWTKWLHIHRYKKGRDYRSTLAALRYALIVSGYGLRRMDLVSMEQALRRVLPTARIVGDKTPSYVFRLNWFAAMEGLSIVLVYRDCRDVVAANLMRVRARTRPTRRQHEFDTAGKIAQRWVRCMELLERNEPAALAVRYEDLVVDPRRELKRVGHWLEIDPGGFDEEAIAQVHTGDIGMYLNYLTQRELSVIGETAGPTMARYGYP